MHGRRHTVTLLLAGIATVAGTGCGATDAELRHTLQKAHDATLSTVTPAEIRTQPPRSPERALMALWRAVQFRDAKTAVGLVSPRPDRKAVPKVEELIVSGAAPLTTQIKPTILAGRRIGERTEMTVLLTRRAKHGNEPVRKITRQVKVGAVWVDGRWRIEAIPLAIQAATVMAL